MIILKIIFLFLFLKIFLDFYFNKSLKSKLVLIPQDYKYRNKDKNSEVIINLKIINKSKNKEKISVCYLFHEASIFFLDHPTFHLIHQFIFSCAFYHSG